MLVYDLAAWFLTSGFTFVGWLKLSIDCGKDYFTLVHISLIFLDFHYPLRGRIAENLMVGREYCLQFVDL